MFSLKTQGLIVRKYSPAQGRRPRKYRLSGQVSLTVMLMTVLLLGSIGLSTAPSWAAGTLTAEMVTQALNNAAQRGAIPRTLWNMGITLFEEYPPSRNLTLALAQGYEKAKATNEEQNTMIKQAARFWRLKYENWNKNRVVATQEPVRDFMYWRYRGEWETWLKMKPSHGPGPHGVNRGTGRLPYPPEW